MDSPRSWPFPRPFPRRFGLICNFDFDHKFVRTRVASEYSRYLMQITPLSYQQTNKIVSRTINYCVQYSLSEHVSYTKTLSFSPIRMVHYISKMIIFRVRFHMQHPLNPKRNRKQHLNFFPKMVPMYAFSRPNEQELFLDSEHRLCIKCTEKKLWPNYAYIPLFRHDMVSHRFSVMCWTKKIYVDKIRYLIWKYDKMR